MKKEERLILNELSTKIWGKSSVWQKFLKNGEHSDMTRTLEDGTEQTYRGIKYFSLDEVKERMATLLKEKEEKDAQKAKEAEEKAQEIAKGT